jgi:hypothetical protein
MIDFRKLMLLGALTAAGCTNSVRQEEFAAYKTQSENTLKALKEEFSAEQKKALTDANARYDALIKEIEALNARLSVSSIDNYAVGLEEQVTQHARRYVQLARTIANMQKKEWDLEEATAKEISKLRADTKTAEDSLAAGLAELKKLFDDAKKSYETFKNEDYKTFKEQSLEEKEARQKNIEALETGMQNLARLIQQIEKNADVSKVLEAAGKKTFVFAARASYENPVTYALAMEQWRIEVEHRKIAGEPVDESPLTRIYRFSKASGEDDVIQVKELKDDELEAKIAELRRKDNKPYEELNIRKLIISDKYKDTASIKIIPADERQEELLTELLEYKTPKQAAYVAGMLGINAKDGKITSEKLDYIMSKVKEKYGK